MNADGRRPGIESTDFTDYTDRGIRSQPPRRQGCQGRPDLRSLIPDYSRNCSVTSSRIRSTTFGFRRFRVTKSEIASCSGT
jgi:hypothetical protein